MSEPQVTIIGAGIVGVASTLWLQRAGFKATLIDSGAVGEGASFGEPATHGAIERAVLRLLRS